MQRGLLIATLFSICLTIGIRKGGRPIPLYGYSPFLHYSFSDWYVTKRLCQFPYTGILHFYRKEYVMAKKLDKSVNSLKRVFSISTVSFHSPLKSRLSELVFAGNCLNILIMTFFNPIFCLFKNCTDINTICYVFYSIIHSALFQYKKRPILKFHEQVFCEKSTFK